MFLQQYKAAGGSGSGSVNSASNLGTGIGVFDALVGDDLQFRSIKGASANFITAALVADDIVLTFDETDLTPFTGDSGAGGVKGVVPAPAAGDAAASKFLKADGTWAATGGGGGTVTSVDLTVPSILSVSGNPITTSGTLAITLATQSANTIFAGPTSGGAATPTFRTMNVADVPNDLITYAKIQNVSAASRLLGRGSAGGSGDVEELTIGTGLSLSGTVLSSTATGTVTSAAVSVTSVPFLSISGSPITTSGTFTFGLVNQGSNNGLFAPANGTSNAPGFRHMVGADLPTSDLLSISGEHFGFDNTNSILSIGNAANIALRLYKVGANTAGALLQLRKTRATDASSGTSATLSSGDTIGDILFEGPVTASTTHVSFASIKGEVDAAVGSGDAPGRLVFSTVPDASTTMTERMRIDSTGLITIAAGQIKFPGTQNASSDVNTLDDYEEGTWTPADTSGASLSLTINIAKYTKIGNLVNIVINLAYPATADGNNASISLPFTLGGATFGLNIGGSWTTTVAGVKSLAVSGTSNVVFYNDGSGTQKTNANLTATTLFVGGSFMV